MHAVAHAVFARRVVVVLVLLKECRPAADMGARGRRPATDLEVRGQLPHRQREIFWSGILEYSGRGERGGRRVLTLFEGGPPWATVS